jgi:hypothetical protein
MGHAPLFQKWTKSEVPCHLFAAHSKRHFRGKRLWGSSSSRILQNFRVRVCIGNSETFWKVTLLHYPYFIRSNLPTFCEIWSTLSGMFPLPLIERDWTKRSSLKWHFRGLINVFNDKINYSLQVNKNLQCRLELQSLILPGIACVVVCFSSTKSAGNPHFGRWPLSCFQ